MSPAVVLHKDDPERRDRQFLTVLSMAIAMGALAFYYRSHALLLYGDAVAHINIARRVFDSRTPGLLQLGTVWLPLPHIIDIPFIWDDWMWSTGLGAAIPSVAAYIAGTRGIFRLLRGLASRAAAWTGALIYALNPNLMYMQSTAMTEALYLALFIWSVVHFSEFVKRAADPATARKSLERCALAVAAAMLVRYDGWFLAAAMTAVIVIAVWRFHLWTGPVRRGCVNFVLLTALTAGLWLAYNHAAYGNALEFANGPYSAHAILQRSLTPTMPVYPGEHDARAAALYFLKVSRLTLAAAPLDYLLFSVAFVSLLGVIYFSRRFLPLSLLWIPVPFYILSVAWGSVPIYLPDWWPHSYYNVRYGLQMLPAVAVFIAVAFGFAARFFPRRYVALAMVLLAGGSYFSAWRETPVCLREAVANGRARMVFESAVAAAVQKLPLRATIMMDCGAHSGVAQAAGIHFSRFLRESNPPDWQIGLSGPAQAADYVIAFEGDDVSRAVRLFPQHLRLVAIIDTPGQAKAFLYQSTH
ncbi:MAG TPA: hypothetical protein VN176_12240 [Verrucomicrobiae bacterium]|jgi:hypothetical protein|nr:hypothetical protein [Verrucomicrobiae bacterium]